MPKAAVTKPMEQCWVCDKRTRKYVQGHHVMGIDNDPDLKVPVCRGCHYLLTMLSRYKRLLTDAKKLGRLVTLARFYAGMPDAKTVIKYEETKEA